MAARHFACTRSKLLGISGEASTLRRTAKLSTVSPTLPVLLPRECRLFKDGSKPHVRAYATATATPEISALKTGKIVKPPPSTSEQVLEKALGKAAKVLDTDTTPSETAVQEALHTCENLARSIAESIEPRESNKAPPKPEKTPTSSLLSLEDRAIPAPHSDLPLSMSTEKTARERVSSLAYKIVTDPKVFVTPALLATYVYTQSVLGRPQSFPEVFEVYASKPVPIPNSKPVRYKDSNPKSSTSAVPYVLAHTALTAALETKDLPLCLKIVVATAYTTAFKREKAIRRGFFPFTAAVLTPPAAYVMATQLAGAQQTMETSLATGLGFFGILTYVAATATLGIVAVTTHNDQMDRVTWAKGTPLRERWIREEERAMIDRIAGAWGFENPEKRGDEEGPEWEGLRDWVGRRGMILDDADLMEGME